MGNLKKTDFYYGSFLSALLNSAGKTPSLFDETDSRRIYKVTTENSPTEHTVIVKYRNHEDSQHKNTRCWTFQFQDSEIEKLIELHEQGAKLKIALLCLTNNLTNCELVLIDYQDAITCLGIDKGMRSPYITVKCKKKHQPRIYGSGREEKIDGSDNSILVKRDAIAQL